MNDKKIKLYTIGHSNIPMDEFINKLKTHDIKTIVDVRSSPYARYADWFNGEYLKKELIKNKIKYRWGKSLGGRPEGSQYYLPKGHVNYRKLSESKKYIDALETLKEEAQIRNTAIMCSEKKYEDCHRNLLIARTLKNEFDILHIVLDKEELEPYKGEPEQATLNIGEEGEQWKSIQPVSQDG